MANSAPFLAKCPSSALFMGTSLSSGIGRDDAGGVQRRGDARYFVQVKFNALGKDNRMVKCLVCGEWGQTKGIDNVRRDLIFLP